MVPPGRPRSVPKLGNGQNGLLYSHVLTTSLNNYTAVQMMGILSSIMTPAHQTHAQFGSELPFITIFLGIPTTYPNRKKKTEKMSFFPFVPGISKLCLTRTLMSNEI